MKGFDIVIANPPFQSSRAGTRLLSPTARQEIAKLFGLKGNFDLSIAFYILGFGFLNEKENKDSLLSFVTSDKWTSKPYGKVLRDLTARLHKIIYLKKDTFIDASIDGVVTLYGKKINKYQSLPPRLCFEFKKSKGKLFDLATCQNACATSDAYKLKPLLFDAATEKTPQTPFISSAVNTKTSQNVFAPLTRPSMSTANSLSTNAAINKTFATKPPAPSLPFNTTFVEKTFATSAPMAPLSPQDTAFSKKTPQTFFDPNTATTKTPQNTFAPSPTPATNNLPTNSTAKTLPVVNTGTLGKYSSFWGEKPMRYLHDSYKEPVVDKASFFSKMGKTYAERAASPKLIIKSLGKLDATVDLEGSFVPAIATLVILPKPLNKNLNELCENSKPLNCERTLLYLAAVLNSTVAFNWLSAHFGGSTYCGATVFTPAMINSLPLPFATEAQIDEIASLVKKLLTAQKNKSSSQAECELLIKTLDKTISRLYGL